LGDASYVTSGARMRCHGNPKVSTDTSLPQQKASNILGPMVPYVSDQLNNSCLTNFPISYIFPYFLQVCSYQQSIHCSLVLLLDNFWQRCERIALLSSANPSLITMLHKMRSSREMPRKVSPPQPVYMNDDQKCRSSPLVPVVTWMSPFRVYMPLASDGDC
jgi:hypothetical protein